MNRPAPTRTARPIRSPGKSGHQQAVHNLEYPGGSLNRQVVESVDLVLAQREPEAEVGRQQRLEPFGFPAIPMSREADVPQFGRKPRFLFEENVQPYFGTGEEAVQRVPLPQPDSGVAVPFGQGRIAFVKDLFEGVLANRPVIQLPDQLLQGRFDGWTRDARTVGGRRTFDRGVCWMGGFGGTIDGRRIVDGLRMRCCRAGARGIGCEENEVEQ